MAGLPRTALDYMKHDEQHAHVLLQFHQYFRGNLDGIFYRSNDLHGSVVNEKIFDLIVKKRIKQQGMRRSVTRVNNLLFYKFSMSMPNLYLYEQALSPLKRMQSTTQFTQSIN